MSEWVNELTLCKKTTKRKTIDKRQWKRDSSVKRVWFFFMITSEQCYFIILTLNDIPLNESFDDLTKVLWMAPCTKWHGHTKITQFYSRPFRFFPSFRTKIYPENWMWCRCTIIIIMNTFVTSCRIPIKFISLMAKKFKKKNTKKMYMCLFFHSLHFNELHGNDFNKAMKSIFLFITNLVEPVWMAKYDLLFRIVLFI